MKKYEIIYRDIISEINSGKLGINEQLPTEHELAEHYNASRVTIRNALEKLEKDGYIRKHQGKGSVVIRRGGDALTVLLIIPNIFNYIFRDLVEGIEETLRAHNITLLLATSSNDQSIERLILKNHIDHIDGIILEPAQVENTKYQKSRTYRKLLTKPTLFINARIPTFKFPYLIVDDEQNTKRLTNYVLSQNVKRILILAKTDDTQGYLRLLGIKQILTKSDVDYLIVEFTTNNEHKKLEDFLFLYEQFKPDCLMFYNDDYAFKFLSTNNIDDSKLLITGYDNTPYSNGMPYSFISPNHPKSVMGVDAAHAIIAMLEGELVQSKVYESDINFNK